MSKVWKMLFFLECVATCRFIGFVLVISAVKTNPNLSGQRTQVKKGRSVGVQPWLHTVRQETCSFLKSHQTHHAWRKVDCFFKC